MLVDTTDIHAFSAALHRHADDLVSIAADLTAARVSPAAFGSIGSGFVAALNDALTTEVHRITQLAERLSAATSSADAAADAYRAADSLAGQSFSVLRV